jgi:hypothetical protein
MWTGRPPQADQTVETTKAPTPTEKPPTRDAKAFQPSSFASRRPQAEANAAITSRRRLVSLGKSEFHEWTSDGDTKVLDCELFMDSTSPATGSSPSRTGWVCIRCRAMTAASR